METRTVKVHVNTYGKAPAKYGSNAYKVGIDDWLILRCAGWTKAGEGRGYIYAIPSESQAGKRVSVDIEVPTDEEIARLAAEFHARREAGGGSVPGFIYRYRPAGTSLYSYRATGSAYADGRTDAPETESQVIRSEAAEFEFGIDGPWGVTLIWDQGDESEPTWRRRER